jgi:hypothetical protein
MHPPVRAGGDNCFAELDIAEFTIELSDEGSAGIEADRRHSGRSDSLEAVGISVPSGGFKTLPGWLENSLVSIVVSCC